MKSTQPKSYHRYYSGEERKGRRTATVWNQYLKAWFRWHVQTHRLRQWRWPLALLHGHRTSRTVPWRLIPTLVSQHPRSGKKFSLATTLNIGIQIITRLEQIHRKGFVHRDIKANNFMIGKKERAKIVYIIDFGLAKRYKDLKTGQHIPVKGGKSLVGTARYASIASHEGF